MKAMIVSGSDINRWSLVQCLRYHFPGLDFDEARGGQEALALLRREPCELVVTGLDMEQGDGIQLIQALRDDPCFDGTHILVYSQHLDILVRAVLGRKSQVGFLAKPATPAELANAVQALWAGDAALSVV
ncbi:MAG TPA: response regulator [bacterium]|jgi:CheY-like chemotaxis protein|nr:response regulator [bacterium]HXB97043.1 response regulator [bacterium]